ncbi:translocon-associated protein subunit alpha isoform X1 [Euwallacea similis]|uniref:translocon-associated protein subunit alpha isoform X1 n=1 Tax=Euwallacea similis TaxID=1736056 RepID=UPI00345109AF
MKYFFLLSLLILPAVVFLADNGRSKMMAFAEEDPIDEEEADVEGEVEEGDVVATESEEDEEESQSKASPDADTVLLFTKPNVQGASQLELVAGTPVEFLVGFRNKGEQDFIVDFIEASFRYPMDFNYFIQNFSAVGYHSIVKPNQEATFQYSFLPGEGFAGRPFGLNINLVYHDLSGNGFQEAVFNETVQIVELDEGFDGETFFLYVFLAATVVLLLVIGQQTLLSVGKKRPSKKSSPPVETGTSNPNNVDYEWLPAQTLASLNKEKIQKSPRATKQQSPRQRKVKRSTGSE